MFDHIQATPEEKLKIDLGAINNELMMQEAALGKEPNYPQLFDMKNKLCDIQSNKQFLE